jgi:hypothetical protein
MAAKLERPKLTRDRLGENGIYYHEKVYGKPDTAPILSIPDHVNNLRVVLLDFSDIQIINNWKRAFSKEKTIVQPLHRPRGIDESDWDLEPPESSYIHPEDLHELRRDWKNEVERREQKFTIPRKSQLLHGICTRTRSLGGWTFSDPTSLSDSKASGMSFMTLTGMMPAPSTS